MSVHEHDFEPVRGLPGVLPAGERVLWQGSPQVLSFLVHALHVRWVIGYFAVITAWRLWAALDGGMTFAAAVSSALWLTPMWLAVIAILAGFAWAVARTTVYTITTRRLVIRQGVALQMAVNVPFSIVESADMRLLGDGTGQIPLTLDGDLRLAYMVIWPHARFGHFINPQPMLRSIADPQSVARILSDALAASGAPLAVPAPVREAPKPGLRPIAIAAE
jgi:hypothetical protein